MSHNWAEPSKRPRDPLHRTIVIIEEPTDSTASRPACRAGPSRTASTCHAAWFASTLRAHRLQSANLRSVHCRSNGGAHARNASGWGKLTVRNFREGDGDVGIIRSPVRSITLPDRGYFTLATSPAMSASFLYGSSASTDVRV